MILFLCRGTRIRTWDPLLPKQGNTACILLISSFLTKSCTISNRYLKVTLFLLCFLIAFFQQNTTSKSRITDFVSEVFNKLSKILSLHTDCATPCLTIYPSKWCANIVFLSNLSKYSLTFIKYLIIRSLPLIFT